MPLWPLAAALLVARQSISQMDVPTRQAYTMAMVTPAERTATASATGAARTIGAAVGPLLGGSLVMWVVPGLNLLAAGGVKAAYDLALYKRFKSVPLLHPAPVPLVELQETRPGQPGKGTYL
jgi:MFS family permease